MENKNFPHIRSYVRRGRTTHAQKRILAEYKHLLVPAKQLSVRLNNLLASYRFTKVILEIGFGNGESLAIMAKQNPQQLFIGIEVHRPGIGCLLGRIVQQAISNLLIVTEDAYFILRDYIPKQTLDRIQIFFPDPWPKKSHHKRRLITQEFTDLAILSLKKGGILHIATDWQPYAELIIKNLTHNTRLINMNKDFTVRPSYRPITKFESIGLKNARQVFDIMFKIV